MNAVTIQETARLGNEGEDSPDSQKYWPFVSSSGGSWVHLRGQPGKLYTWSHITGTEQGFTCKAQAGWRSLLYRTGWNPIEDCTVAKCNPIQDCMVAK